MNRQTLLKQYAAVDWRDKQLLLAQVLQITKEDLVSHPEKKISPRKQWQYYRLIKRRLEHEPLAYLLGTQPFYGLNFLVNKHTLIPRPETEWIVDKTRELAKSTNIKTIIDIGTGSGALAIAIAKYLPKKRVFAIDVSKNALKIAKKNAELNGVHITFLHGNLCEPLQKEILNDNSLLVANLPYLPETVYLNCTDEVKKEPKLALLGGNDGLDLYRLLLAQLTMLPYSVFECDPLNAQALTKLIKEKFPSAAIAIEKDFNDLDRYVFNT